MKTKIYNIKITDCSKPGMWYTNKIGRTFNAIRCHHPFIYGVIVFRISVLCWIYESDIQLLGSADVEKYDTETIFPQLQTITI